MKQVKLMFNEDMTSPILSILEHNDVVLDVINESTYNDGDAGVFVALSLLTRAILTRH